MLSESGLKFLAFARQTLDNWQAFKTQTQIDSKMLKGQLKVFCSVTASYSHIPPILNRLSKKHPNVDILLETGAASLAIKKIEQGSVDIAISAKPEQLPTNIAFKQIDLIHVSLIAPVMPCDVNDKLAEPQPSWQNIPFIIADAGLTKTRSEKWFRSHHIKPNIYARVAGHEAIVSMVALGCGVGLAPDIVIENSPVRDKVRTLDAGKDIESFLIFLCIILS